MSSTLRLIYERDPLFTFIDCCHVKSLLFKVIGYSSCYRQRNENVTALSKDTERHAESERDKVRSETFHKSPTFHII